MLNRFQDVFRSFQRHGVKCVVIGGVAAILHGVPRATFDLNQFTPHLRFGANPMSRYAGINLAADWLVLGLVAIVVLAHGCTSTQPKFHDNAAQASATADEWLCKSPPNDFIRKNDGRISKDDFCEVVASFVDAAVEVYLADTDYLEIDESQVAGFTGGHFSTEPGKRSYLVRAAFVHGMTGGYRLIRVGNSLVVLHESLGPNRDYTKSALVVNLDFELESVMPVAKTVE